MMSRAKRDTLSAEADASASGGTGVRITSAEDGVFACGQRHPLGPVDYPVGWFSARQIAQMQALDALTVEILKPEIMPG